MPVESLEGQYRPGMACLNGEGMAKDEAEAGKWLSSAAKSGHGQAQEVLKERPDLRAPA